MAEKSDVAITGEIVVGDYDKFINLIQMEFLDKNRILGGIIVDSHGGVLNEAIRISHVVHDIRATVIVEANSFCESACFVILAGAGTRLLSPTAHIMVHSARSESDLGSSTFEDAQSAIDTITAARLYKQYGVSAEIIGRMVTTPANDRYYLNLKELISLSSKGNVE